MLRPGSCGTAAVVAVVLAVAGCASQAPGSGASSHADSGANARSATLVVHIGLLDGPLRPDGRMALSNSPAARENVTALRADSPRRSAVTDSRGVATLRLEPGRYTVFSTDCGGRHQVVLTAGRTTSVQIVCPVP